MAPDSHARACALLDRQAVEDTKQSMRPNAFGWGGTWKTVECAARALRSTARFAISASPAWNFRRCLPNARRCASPGDRVALCWLTGVATAPLVWRGFEWAGRLTGIPDIWLKVAPGLW